MVIYGTGLNDITNEWDVQFFMDDVLGNKPESNNHAKYLRLSFLYLSGVGFARTVPDLHSIVPDWLHNHFINRHFIFRR